MKKQFIVSLIANASRVVLGFVFFWQIARALQLETLGDYLYVTAALGYFGTLIDYGFNLFVLNTVSRSNVEARALFVQIVSSKVLLMGLALAILAGLYGLAFSEHGLLVTALFFLVVVLQSFSGLLIQFFKALGRFDHELASTIMGSALPVIIVFSLQGTLTLTSLGLIVLGVRLVVLTFQSIMFLQLTSGQSWFNPEKRGTRLWHGVWRDIRGNFKYAVFSILGAIFMSIDLVVMRFVLGPEDVSVYGSAMKIIVAVVLFFDVLTGIFIPHLARLHGQSQQQFRKSTWVFAGLMMLGATVVSVGLLTLGPMAMTVAFGPEFEQAGQVLQVLSLVLLFRIMTMVSGALLTVQGLQAWRAKVMIIVLPVHVVLNLILQPYFGIWGAVATLTFSFLLFFTLSTVGLLPRRNVENA